MFFAVTSWSLCLLSHNLKDKIITTYFHIPIMFDRRNMPFKFVKGLWTYEVMTQFFAWFVDIVGAVKYNIGFRERNEIAKI